MASLSKDFSSITDINGLARYATEAIQNLLGRFRARNRPEYASAVIVMKD
jgi:hypothetical protein